MDNSSATMSFKALKDLTAQGLTKNSAFKGMYDPVIYTHPNNIDLLSQTFPPYRARDTHQNIYGYGIPMFLYGMKLIANKNMDQFTKMWEFPHDRFVEYEPSDEPWCRYCNIGREVFSKDPLFLVVDQKPAFVQYAKTPQAFTDYGYDKRSYYRQQFGTFY